MTATNDPLFAAVNLLEKTLAQNAGGDAHDPARLDQTLASVEEAIRAHGAMTGPVGEPVVDLDRPLLPSPGVHRRRVELRAQLAVLLRETRALRNKLRTAASSAVLAPDAICLVEGALNPSGDLRSFFERARELAARLESFEKEEFYFIQDSVTTDIGAGD